MNQTPVILCIDDDDEICFALKALFKLQKWQGLSANNMAQALQKFRSNQPDIVLIDYHMPKINGIDGVRMLRKLSADVPIIVFTIDESQQVADAFLEAGASDFALKPIKAPDIVSRIKLHLQLLDWESKKLENAPQLAKGLSQGTMDLIVTFLRAQQDYVTANEIAEGTGLAYQTVFRYLQYMVQEALVEQVNTYGKVGRPKQSCHLVRQ